MDKDVDWLVVCAAAENMSIDDITIEFVRAQRKQREFVEARLRSTELEAILRDARAW